MKKNTTDIGKIAEQIDKEQTIFLGKQKIVDHYSAIDIPSDAVLLKAKKRYVKFFKGAMPSNVNNGWTAIPENVVSVCFPKFRENYGQNEIGKKGDPFHITYGNPIFKEKDQCPLSY